MNKKHIAMMVILLNISSVVSANVGTDLDNFMDNVGFVSNTTSPQAFQSQATGYYGGGSLYARNPVRNYQLVNVDLPDHRAGCAGIDLYAGSLSYLSSEKLVGLGKSVMTNSGAYAVDVMLASTVPQLKQVRDYLQAMVQKVNSMSINSCELSQNAIGGIFPKTALSQQKICNDQHRMGQQGLGHDYVAARMNCSGDGFKETMDDAAKNPQHKDQVVLNKNIVWSLLKEKTFIGSNQELAEMMMSLTGTIIFDKEGHATNIPAMGVNSGLIDVLIGNLNGDSHKAQIWHCDETVHCLHVTQADFTIPAEKSLSGRIRKKIHELDEKIKNDTPQDKSDEAFLSITPIPVFKFLTVLNNTQYGNAAVDMSDYSTLIAQDMMQHYLSELFSQLSNATQGSSIPEDLLKSIEKRIDSASMKIAAIDPLVSQKLTQKLALINNIVRVEKQLASSLYSS
jgi:conjugative transfer pilus assembly protein TraH